MFKFYILKVYFKDRVLLSFKDFVFIFTWLFLLLMIADAGAGQPRMISFFLWVWYILGFIYLLKIIDNFSLQKTPRTDEIPVLENESKPAKVTKHRFFEA